MKEFKCAGCGSTKTVRHQVGEYADILCVGCGYGITSPRYTGYKPPTCYKCGSPKVSDLFKGEYCPSCNDWC